MKQILLTTALTFLLAAPALQAQDFENPGAYISYINQAQNDLSKKYLGYMSAASHGKNMKKIEKKRNDVLNAIDATRAKVFDMPSYKGDKTLRDAATGYLKLMYTVFNEDYSKIVNMEEIAEQSYDAMEAYLLAQEKAGEKLKDAFEAYAGTQKDFAARNAVNLVDQESELDRKLEQVERVNQYYHQVYLIFFKSHKQEMYLMNALKEENVNAIEQNRNTLARYAQEGLDKLGELKGYNGDRSVENSTRQVLQFLKDEAEKKFPVLSDFLMRSENFAQVKKAFESRTEPSREDVDTYNKALKEMNKGVDGYNKMNQQLNASRAQLIAGYNESVQTFMDTHMPYAN